MYRVKFDRLIKSAEISFRNDFEWDSHTITLKDIRDAIKCGMHGTDIPYGDTMDHRVGRIEDKEYHICRVLYFVEHPSEISGIQVDNECDGRYILPHASIVDGWHRLLAAKYLGLTEIDIEYGGRQDILDYLIGTRKNQPYTTI